MTDTQTPAPSPAQVKKPWESVALWGGLMSVLSGVGSVAGWLTTEQADILNSEAPMVIVSMIGVFGGVTTIYGRFKASSRISLK